MHTLPFEKINKDSVKEAGGKGASLGEMTQAGIPVPPGFVVLSSSFDKFLNDTNLNTEIDATLHSVRHEDMESVERASEMIQALILQADMPEGIAEEIKKEFKNLDAEYVAVRSSATAEDGATAAWAGQLDTFLNTTEKDLLEKVKKCWASLFTPRAIFYRFEKGLHAAPISVAVVVQKMVQSEISGIAFSVHPVTEDRNQMIIEAALGLGEAIVSGQITPDSYVVEKDPRRIIDTYVATQEKGLFKSEHGGNEWKDIPESEGEKQVLSDEQILELAELVLKIENHYGFPCDIEWAYEKGEFFITQSRPITTLKPIVEEQKTEEKQLENKWILAEHIPDCDIFFFQIPSTCFVNDTSYPFITKYSEFLAIYRGVEMKFYFKEDNSHEVGESILAALIEREDFGKEINEKIEEWSQKLIDFAKGVYEKDLTKASNEELWSLYEEHDKIHTKLYTYGWLSVAVDMFHNNFTDYLKDYLRTVCDTDEEVENAFIIMTTPFKKTIVAEEREEFLSLYDKHRKELEEISELEKKILSDELENDLKEHSEKWGHLGYIFAGNAEGFGLEHYLKEMIDLVKTGVSGTEVLKKEDNQLKEAKKKIQAFEDQIDMDELPKRLFGYARDFALTKLVRRHAQLLDLWLLHRSLLEEIAKRLDLSRLEVQFMLKDEVKDALLENKLDRAELQKRLKYCAFYTAKGVEEIYTGKKAEELEDEIEEVENGDVEEIKGQVAQPGTAKGEVKIIIRAADMEKMNEGDILVSIATDPDIVPAMKKAAAIVTEQGGITSHAAIVSRELGTPCVIGTKIATKILNDGDIVEVDAIKGLIKIVKRVDV